MSELVAYGFVGKRPDVLYRMGIRKTYPCVLVLKNKAVVLKDKCLVINY